MGIELWLGENIEYSLLCRVQMQKLSLQRTDCGSNCMILRAVCSGAKLATPQWCTVWSMTATVLACDAESQSVYASASYNVCFRSTPSNITPETLEYFRVLLCLDAKVPPSHGAAWHLNQTPQSILKLLNRT